jgi:hypothetical protein
MVRSWRGLLRLAFYVALVGAGLWASLTDVGISSMRGAWVAQGHEGNGLLS